MIKIYIEHKEKACLSMQHIVFIRHNLEAEYKSYQIIIHRFETTGQFEFHNGYICKPYSII